MSIKCLITPMLYIEESILEIGCFLSLVFLQLLPHFSLILVSHHLLHRHLPQHPPSPPEIPSVLLAQPSKPVPPPNWGQQSP